MQQAIVRALEHGDIAACEQILGGLPDWFGIEESVIDYVRSLDSLPVLVATTDGEMSLSG